MYFVIVLGICNCIGYIVYCIGYMYWVYCTWLYCILYLVYVLGIYCDYTGAVPHPSLL